MRRRARPKLAETLIVAMIAAAKADGHIDAEERGRIYQRLEEGGLQPEEVAFLQRELTEPVDIERIVAGATTKEAAIEIYAASLMAVRTDTPQERDYLATLAEPAQPRAGPRGLDREDGRRGGGEVGKARGPTRGTPNDRKAPSGFPQPTPPCQAGAANCAARRRAAVVPG